jgi:methionyl aminopeptidase
MDDTRGRITRDGIRIHEDADFAGMHAAGRVAAEILDLVAPLVQPGATTGEIDDFITSEIARRTASFPPPSATRAISTPPASA